MRAPRKARTIEGRDQAAAHQECQGSADQLRAGLSLGMSALR
jgi:hypothetical protein